MIETKMLNVYPETMAEGSRFIGIDAGAETLKDRKHWLLFWFQVTPLDPGRNSLRALTRLLII
jgi:hypothetical protein